MITIELLLVTSTDKATESQLVHFSFIAAVMLQPSVSNIQNEYYNVRTTDKAYAVPMHCFQSANWNIYVQ